MMQVYYIQTTSKFSFRAGQKPIFEVVCVCLALMPNSSKTQQFYFFQNLSVVFMQQHLYTRENSKFAKNHDENNVFRQSSINDGNDITIRFFWMIKTILSHQPSPVEGTVSF